MLHNFNTNFKYFDKTFSILINLSVFWYKIQVFWNELYTNYNFLKYYKCHKYYLSKQACRLKKCADAGMKSSWVMTEEEKMDKKLRATAKKTPDGTPIPKVKPPPAARKADQAVPPQAGTLQSYMARRKMYLHSKRRRNQVEEWSSVDSLNVQVSFTRMFKCLLLECSNVRNVQTSIVKCLNVNYLNVDCMNLDCMNVYCSNVDCSNVWNVQTSIDKCLNVDCLNVDCMNLNCMNVYCSNVDCSNVVWFNVDWLNVDWSNVNW